MKLMTIPRPPMATAYVGARVRYVPGHAQGDVNHPDCEDGAISSIKGDIVFVRFDSAVERFGWDETTAQACSPEDLGLL